MKPLRLGSLLGIWNIFGIWSLSSQNTRTYFKHAEVKFWKDINVLKPIDYIILTLFYERFHKVFVSRTLRTPCFYFLSTLKNLGAILLSPLLCFSSEIKWQIWYTRVNISNCLPGVRHLEAYQILPTQTVHLKLGVNWIFVKVAMYHFPSRE